MAVFWRAIPIRVLLQKKMGASLVQSWLETMEEEGISIILLFCRIFKNRESVEHWFMRL